MIPAVKLEEQHEEDSTDASKMFEIEYVGMDESAIGSGRVRISYY